jgi:acyl carrier protein
MLQMDELGIEIPMDAAWSVRTVEDAYNLYAQNAAKAG